MIRALIADDERPARRKLRELLGRAADFEVVAEAGDGIAAVAAIREARPDVVFLDIQMPRLDGFGVIAAIGVEAMPLVVFVTAFDEHAVRAFEVHALDYLLKPFAPSRLQRLLDRVRRQLAAPSTATPVTPAASAAAEPAGSTSAGSTSAGSTSAASTSAGSTAAGSSAAASDLAAGGEASLHGGFAARLTEAGGEPLAERLERLLAALSAMAAAPAMTATPAAAEMPAEAEMPAGAGRAARDARPGRPATRPMQEYPRQILVEREAGRQALLAVDDIDVVRAEGNYLRFIGAGGQYRRRGTLKELIERLDPTRFLRLNRSEIVRLDAIRELQPWFHGDARVLLRDGSVLTWSRRYRSQAEGIF